MSVLLVTATLASASYWLYVQKLIGEYTALLLLTLVLLGFLTAQVLRLRRVHPQRWMVNPVVFSSFACFVLSYGITNFFYFLPPDWAAPRGLATEITTTMVRHMALAVVGACAMWAGYWSPVAAGLSRDSLASAFQSRFLPSTDHLRPFVLPILVLIATVSRLAAVRLEIFGYATRSIEHLVELSAYAQYLFLGGDLGKLALALVASQVYSGRKSSSNLIWFYGLLVSEVAWGLLSGFKSQVVFPLVLVGLLHYLIKGRVSIRLLVSVAAGLAVAYAVIEPFRRARYLDENFDGRSLAAIISVMTSASATKPTSVASTPLVVTIAERLNYTGVGSLGLDYADKGHTDATDPEFLKDILLAPVYAVVPRFLWKDKPIRDDGLWYNQVVQGNTHSSFSMMGQVTYLYFAGGYLAVVLGFFIAGCLQRIIFFLLRPWQSAGAALVFVANLGVLSLATTLFSGVLANLCRELPLLILIMFLVFRSPPVPPKRTNRIRGLATPPL